MKHTKITAVFGTRPEAIKMCPLILELKNRKSVDVRVVVSGQHRELCREVLEYFGVTPELDLNIMSHGQTLLDITEKILSEMTAELLENPPDVLLVHGDTATAFSSSLAAFYLGIKVGHVEAGFVRVIFFRPIPRNFTADRSTRCPFFTSVRPRYR